MPAVAQPVGDTCQGVENEKQAAEDQGTQLNCTSRAQCEKYRYDPEAIEPGKYPQYAGLKRNRRCQSIRSNKVVHLRKQIKCQKNPSISGCHQLEQGDLVKLIMVRSLQGRRVGLSGIGVFSILDGVTLLHLGSFFTNRDGRGDGEAKPDYYSFRAIALTPLRAGHFEEYFWPLSQCSLST